ncbi:19932_t:CDS:2 [Funneliformis geosporum]|uniref:19932_t:CDS:1 n=1 Tax=Funneliformis geosporum TaxID=1117311 RepID=A0A9W4SZJ4_9GLOM|nr:19932_t:CDS:2 [Funneliformis geosporum]
MPYKKNGETKIEAKRVEGKLRSDNPILCGTPTTNLSFYYYDDYNVSVFPFLFNNDQVKRIGVDFDKARYNPDDYFKPLDIAMVFNDEKILRYHPVIAFKKTDEIIKHIANCVEGEENYYSRSNLKKGPFRIKKRDGYENSNNCENFVNRCVLGLDFSELGEKKAEEKIQGYKRKTEINISEHLNKTKSELDRLVNNVP